MGARILASAVNWGMARWFIGARRGAITVTLTHDPAKATIAAEALDAPPRRPARRTRPGRRGHSVWFGPELFSARVDGQITCQRVAQRALEALVFTRRSRTALNTAERPGQTATGPFKL